MPLYHSQRNIPRQARLQMIVHEGAQELVGCPCLVRGTGCALGDDRGFCIRPASQHGKGIVSDGHDEGVVRVSTGSTQQSAS